MSPKQAQWPIFFIIFIETFIGKEHLRQVEKNFWITFFFSEESPQVEKLCIECHCTTLFIQPWHLSLANIKGNTNGFQLFLVWSLAFYRPHKVYIVFIKWYWCENWTDFCRNDRYMRHFYMLLKICYVIVHGDMKFDSDDRICSMVEHISTNKLNRNWLKTLQNVIYPLKKKTKGYTAQWMLPFLRNDVFLTMFLHQQIKEVCLTFVA